MTQEVFKTYETIGSMVVPGSSVWCLAVDVCLRLGSGMRTVEAVDSTKFTVTKVSGEEYIIRLVSKTAKKANMIVEI